MEDGTITLVGATTENPSFELNAALLSRAQVLRLNSFSPEELEQLTHGAESVSSGKLPLDEDAATALYELADGGRARHCSGWSRRCSPRPSLGGLDRAGLLRSCSGALRSTTRSRTGTTTSSRAAQDRARLRSRRGTLLSRAHAGRGEDPLFLARRLIRMASEDIGMADPQALPLAIAARDAYEMLGSPEGELALARSPSISRSRPNRTRSYTAFGAAIAICQIQGSPMPPMTILNAPTKLMKGQGLWRGLRI
jgi:putative ATPase